MKVAVASNSNNVISAAPSAGNIVQSSRIKSNSNNNNQMNTAHTPFTTTNYSKPSFLRYSSAVSSSAITPANQLKL